MKSILVFIITLGLINIGYANNKLDAFTKSAISRVLRGSNKDKQHFKICGIPTKPCAGKGGKCMTRTDCLNYLSHSNLSGEWKPDYCKIEKRKQKKGKNKFPDKTVPEKEICGCCLKFPDDKPENIDDEKKSQPQSIGFAIPLSSEKNNEIFQMSFGLNDLENPEIKNLNLLIDMQSSESKISKWSFNNFAGISSKFDCDENKKSCIAHIKGNAHSQFVDDLFPPEKHQPKDGKGRLLEETNGTDAVFISQLIPAELTLNFGENFLQLNDVRKQLGKLSETREVEIGGDLIAKLDINPNNKQEKLLGKHMSFSKKLKFSTKWRLVPIVEFEYWSKFKLYERKKNLCVQPVRTKYRECLFEMFGLCWLRSPTYTYSGDGLAFGKPGANDEWGKVDITFTWRNWITIDDTTGKYQSLTEAEMSSLRSEVNEDDCIEVFFVRKFNPSSTYGGGACWSSGTANAKIISSDEQVACGVDKTHLAHELAHAMGLMHPGSGGNEGDTGTLACPSGWQRDNPRRNSRDNGNKVVNPLLLNYWGAWTFSNPDCNDSASCGTCNAHIPSDSC